MRRALFGLVVLVGLCLGRDVLAAAGPSYPAASQPLGNNPDIVLLYQGAGCSANTGPCSTVTSPSLRFGQPQQTNCAAISAPFQYQECIDTSVSPVVLKQYIGTTWWSLYSLSGSSGITWQSPAIISPTITAPVVVNGASTTTTGAVTINGSGTEQNGALLINQMHAAGAPFVAALGLFSTSIGTNTAPFQGVTNIYSHVADDPSVTALTKGVLYGADIAVAPIVARNNPPYDDVAGLVISNLGTASGTEALYFGHGGSTSQDWISTITLDDNSVYGILFAPGRSFTYGINLSGATFSGATILIPNGQGIYERNGVDYLLVGSDGANAILLGSSASPSIIAGAPFEIVGGGAGAASLSIIPNTTTALGVLMTGTYTGIPIDLGTVTTGSFAAMRIPNNLAIAQKNGGTDFSLIASDTSNNVVVGQATTTTLVEGTTKFPTGSGVVVGAATGGPISGGTINIQNGLYMQGSLVITTGGGLIGTGTAPAVGAGQIGYGGTTVAAGFCGGGGVTACVVIDVAGVQHFMAYY